MSWATAYGPTGLNQDNALGGTPWCYVMRLPAIAVGGPNMRLRLRGPASGSSRVQAMWVGAAGTDYNFAGTPQQVRVNGAGAFTLSAGSIVNTDALTPISGDVLVAYEMLAGDYYRANWAAVSGLVAYWKQTTADAANQSKTGYTINPGKFAVIEAVELGSPDAAGGADEGGDTSIGEDVVLLGQARAAGDVFACDPDKYLHAYLWNPAASANVIVLYQAFITPDADCVVSVRSIQSAPVGTPLVNCNLYYGHGPGSAQMVVRQEPVIVGNRHSVFKLRGGVRAKIDAMIGLDPGLFGAALAIHSPGVGAVISFEWRDR